MSKVICDKQNCEYRSGGGVCVRPFVFIGQYGICSIWSEKNGQPRPTPNDYAIPRQRRGAESKPQSSVQPNSDATSEQQSPQQENTKDLGAEEKA